MADKRPRLRAEALAAGLPPLLVAAHKVAASVAQGTHGRRRSGPGEGFWQFRRYQPGDPAATVDWRQSAKSDPLYVRETEWSAAQTVWLWVDPSASMRWRSDAALPSKFDRACLLALALAILLCRAGERVSLLGADFAPAADARAPDRLAAALDRASGPLATQSLPRNALVVLFSDFFDTDGTIGQAVQQWTGDGVGGQFVQILDPAEESFPYDGRVLFTGLENEGAFLADHAASLRAAYRQRLLAHRDQLAGTARAIGWGFTLHHTDSPSTQPLIALHSALSGG